MHERSSDAFDFDDWAGLYRRDPDAFEARRQAVLGLELARADERRREAGRRALACFDRAASGLPPERRAALAATMMRESLVELGERLEALREAVPEG